MASVRHQLLYLAVFLIVSVLTVRAADFVKGEKGPKDELVCKDTIYKAARPNEIVESSFTCKVPKWNHKITFIGAFDKERNFTGGYAEIEKGGLGEKKVILRLRSEIGKALSFNIQIYAKEFK